jgi:hypothetical protein
VKLWFSAYLMVTYISVCLLRFRNNGKVSVLEHTFMQQLDTMVPIVAKLYRTSGRINAVTTKGYCLKTFLRKVGPESHYLNN